MGGKYYLKEQMFITVKFSVLGKNLPIQILRQEYYLGSLTRNQYKRENSLPVLETQILNLLIKEKVRLNFIGMVNQLLLPNYFFSLHGLGKKIHAPMS
jgi:hypothetical protein